MRYSQSCSEVAAALPFMVRNVITAFIRATKATINITSATTVMIANILSFCDETADKGFFC